MKRVTKQLTYANVMASLAVFLVLAGGTAFAASQLGKNSVGSKQIKKNAVTAAKIKKNAVTTAKVKNNAITTAKIKDGAITGPKVNLGSLGTVPNAAKSEKTDQIVNIFVPLKKGAPKTTILSLGGLTITGTCLADGTENEIEATTTVAHSVITVVTGQDGDNNANLDFNPGEPFEFDLAHSEGDTEMYTGQYTTPAGVNVVVTVYDVDPEEGGVFPTTPQASDCLYAGSAVIS